MCLHAHDWPFAVQPTAITDEDIDAIIQKGMRDTEALNQKLTTFSDNARNFTMDGGIAYEYQDPNDVEGQGIDYKQLAGGSCCRNLGSTCVRGRLSPGSSTSDQSGCRICVCCVLAGHI